MSRLQASAWALLLTSNACSGPLPLAEGKVYQWGDTYRLAEVFPVVSLLVVDDGETAEAALVRERVMTDLDAALTSFRTYGPVVDPAEWRPVDDSLVIAFPSALPEFRLVGPLRYLHDKTTAETEAAFMEQVRAAMTDPPADRGPFLPLETFDTAFSLIDQSRPPEGSAEREVVDALPEPNYGVVSLLAASKDDEGSEPPPEGTYGEASGIDGPSPGTFISYAQPSAFVPAAPEDGPYCSPAKGIGRLAEWIALNGVSAKAFGPECTEDSDRIISGPGADWGIGCVREPHVDADGSASCRVTVETSEASCDESRAWHPLDDGGTEDGRTRCEVRQHVGAELDACRPALDADLPSGWCWTEAFDLPGRWCPSDRAPHVKLRFTGSARFGKGVLTVRCEGP